jgi:lipopolysaccharide biosynthesis glycosyltransferase
MKPEINGRATSEIVVVSCADEAYAMPLAVTIRSALDALAPACRMRLFILDGGISAESQAKLAASWNDPRLAVEWLRPDVDAVRDLPVSDHISIAAYLRLLMPALLPADVQRVIYLDADMFVRRDLLDLWSEPQGEDAALAVQDLAAPFLDAEASIPQFQRCCGHLAAFTPVANYRDLGLPTANKYFNSGLLVLNIEQWRRERIGEQVLDCLREHRRHVLWWDQYALNVVLASKWRALDLRWNQGAHVFVYPTWRESWLDQQRFVQLRNDPWIVHFCSPSKPWHYFCRHPYASDFRACLRRTEWREWRPMAPDRLLSKWWDFHYRPLRNEWKAHLRTVKRAIRGEKRRAA